jgi:hypothetical protein
MCVDIRPLEPNIVLSLIMHRVPRHKGLVKYGVNEMVCSAIVSVAPGIPFLSFLEINDSRLKYDWLLT